MAETYAGKQQITFEGRNQIKRQCCWTINDTSPNGLL